MKVERAIGHAPRVQSLGQSLAEMQGPCIACKDCAGLCHALFDLLLLPETVLKGGRA